MLMLFSAIAEAIVYLFAFCLCVLGTAIVCGAMLKAAAGEFFRGFLLGVVISMIVTACLLFTTSLPATFMTTAGICVLLMLVTCLVLRVNAKLYAGSITRT